MHHYKLGRKNGRTRGDKVKKRRNYSKGPNHDKLKLAVDLYAIGTYSIRKAAAAANVSYAVLQARLARPKMKQQCGRQPALCEEVTAKFAKMCKQLAEMGYPLSRQELRRSITEYAARHCPTAFKAKGPCGEFKGPSREWMEKFFRDHYELSLRTPEQTSLARMIAFNEASVDSFYSALEKIFEMHPELRNNAGATWNADESSFPTDPNGSCDKVITVRGMRTVMSNIEGSGRSNYTVLACGSAAGARMPPLILYRGIKFQQSWNQYINTYCR